MKNIKIYNNEASKKSISLHINSDLLKKVKALNIELSEAFEEKFEELVRRYECSRWTEENRCAIDDYNKSINEYGSFSDDVRSF